MRTIYQPPPRKAIDAHARGVCERLAKRYGAAYAHHEVVWGFSRFLQLAAEILAKHLNKESADRDEELDSESD